jgi:hypothetical protein
MITLRTFVTGLQQMLDKCVQIGEILSLSINPDKSTGVAMSRLAHLKLDPTSLHNDNIQWVSSIKYHGVHNAGGKQLSFHADPTRQAFFAAVYVQFWLLDELRPNHLTFQERLSVVSYTITA